MMSRLMKVSRSARILVSDKYLQEHGRELLELAQRNDFSLEFVQVPAPQEKEPHLVRWDAENVMDTQELRNVNAAFISEDVLSDWGTFRRFFGAIRDAPSCEWVQISWIGRDFPIFDAITSKPNLVITNAAGANALPIATSVFAAIASFNRGFLEWRKAQQERRWLGRQELKVRRDLSTETVLVFGFGAIGQEIGRLCRKMDMNVIGVKQNVPEIINKDIASRIVSDCDSVIGEADYIVVSAPLTDTTKGFFSRQRLEQIKPSAYFLNVGRGPIVDEFALTEMLENRRIAGAFLDVFVKEPLPSESKLWDLDNVIVAPHDAAICADNSERSHAIFSENLTKFVSAEPLSNVIFQQ